ncbi:MEKHLA domain-containing protein [Mycobacterium sp. KBS0706]|uniref:MEKHLA domain-containing protein n=1 Tax=Mycobacterium sp. KBS0706 TaxID=2578109 RepID=UPI00110FE346|nr:MEKHLA domain-containing protein [Mycobacterium sp. KBS0706]TSD89846.1 MEKHLA domain-containing protein [Mycobacterium sp. KBS0706]
MQSRPAPRADLYAVSLARDPDFLRLLAGSHARLVGAPLLPEDARDDEARARWLYEAAPFCVLAHNTDADPRFIYANRAAQARFEYGWDEFTTLPSRLSAEAPDRAERQRLLDAVTRDGFIGDYRGLRIAKSGRRFWIESATVWQLVDEAGALHGQAAAFRDWREM